MVRFAVGSYTAFKQTGDRVPFCQVGFLAVWVLSLGGCMAWGDKTHDPLRVPVRDMSQPFPIQKGSHVVAKGETLFLIAWATGWNYQELAALNGLRPPYRIFPGQRLFFEKRTDGPGNSSGVSRPVAASDALHVSPAGVAVKPSVSQVDTARAKPPQPPKSTLSVARGVWKWPVKARPGQIKSIPRGLEIAGEWGTPTYAAYPGKVVYAGSGLKAYGRLVIIRHRGDLMSAYAYHHTLDVKEGDWVEAGTRLGTMGYGPKHKATLLFEIRSHGAVQNPLRYLPRIQ